MEGVCFAALGAVTKGVLLGIGYFSSQCFLPRAGFSFSGIGNLKSEVNGGGVASVGRSA